MGLLPHSLGTYLLSRNVSGSEIVIVSSNFAEDESISMLFKVEIITKCIQNTIMEFFPR